MAVVAESIPQSEELGEKGSEPEDVQVKVDETYDKDDNLVENMEKCNRESVLWKQRCWGMADWKFRLHRLFILAFSLFLMLYFQSVNGDAQWKFWNGQFFRWKIQGLSQGVDTSKFLVWKDDSGIFLVMSVQFMMSIEMMHSMGFDVSGYHIRNYEPKLYPVSEKVGWFLFYAPAAGMAFLCLMYCLVDQSQSCIDTACETPLGGGVVCCFLMFFHHMKRLWEEQYAQHSNKTIGMESYSMVAQSYTILAWTTCKSAYEINRPFNDPYMVIGVLLWTFAMIGNTYCHMILSKVERHVLPDGNLSRVDLASESACFNIHKPHYWFDLLQWIGFFFLTSSPSGLIYVIYILLLNGMIGI